MDDFAVADDFVDSLWGLQNIVRRINGYAGNPPDSMRDELQRELDNFGRAITQVLVRHDRKDEHGSGNP